MAKKSGLLIHIDLRENGGELRFRSVDEIQAWVGQEVNFWQWLQKCTSYDSMTSSIWSQQASPWNKLNDHLERIKSSSNDEEKAAHLKAIQEILSNHYESGKSLHSSTPRAKRLLDYSHDDKNQNDIVTAAYMLAYFIKAPLQLNIRNPNSISTVIVATQEAMLFSKGVTGISESERAALDELRETHQKLNNELREQIAGSRDVLESVGAEFTTLHKTQSERFDALYDSSKKTLVDITNTYDKKLALQSAVSYWTEKARRHRNFSIGFGAGFAIVLTAIGYFSFKEIYPLLKDVPPNEKPEYWVIALIIITAVVSIWIVRLIVRVLLSHIHLQRDSSERATMLLTYLALLREGSGLKEDEKKLILQALFRPSASGIIRDDAIPPGIYDYITRPR